MHAQKRSVADIIFILFPLILHPENRFYRLKPKFRSWTRRFALISWARSQLHMLVISPIGYAYAVRLAYHPNILARIILANCGN
jgi:hypothetical protein